MKVHNAQTWPDLAPGAVGRDLPLIGYSAGNFGKNLLLSGVDTTLMFVLTDLLAIAPFTASMLMFLVFVGDLLFDVGAGYLASFARFRGFGYRRMIVVGAIPCATTFALLYSLPALHWHGFTTVAIILLTFRAAYAVIDVPHNSLLARVAHDSRSRGRASGYRLFFSTLASLMIATVLTPSVVRAAGGSITSHLAHLAMAAALLFCLSLWIAAWSSDEDRLTVATDRTQRIALFPKFDRLLLGLAAIALVTGFAMPMFGRMVIYLSTYVLHEYIDCLDAYMYACRMARQKSDEKRSAILRAATRVIVVQGLSAPTMAIAKEAGVANGSLFTYFETKTDLFNQLFLELKMELSGHAIDIPVDVGVREQSFHLWKKWMDWAVSNPEKRRAYAQLIVSDEITPKSRAAGDKMMMPVVDLLERARARGPMRNVSMKFLVALLNSVVDATMDFMTQDPTNAKKHSNEGFDAFWRMIS